MKEWLADEPKQIIQDKKTSKLSFLKEKGALKKWFIAAEIIGIRVK